MRRAAVLALALTGAVGLAGPSTAAPSRRVEVMVAGRSAVLHAASTVFARATRVKVGRTRCAVPANTPLAALAATGLSLGMRDYGCGPGSLFVERIRRERATAVNGWVYKIGRRAPGVSAGTPRVKARARVLWFWCRQGARGCQRTLEVSASAGRVAPGAPVAFTVVGYDDRGKGVPVSGAAVRFAGAVLTTGADGTAATTAPAAPGRRTARATAPGLVASFPVQVVVG